MSIKDFHAKFTSGSETSELFAALRRLSLRADTAVIRTNDWIVWGN